MRTGRGGPQSALRLRIAVAAVALTATLGAAAVGLGLRPGAGHDAGVPPVTAAGTLPPRATAPAEGRWATIGPAMARSRPVRVDIPSIEVTSRVLGLGIDELGQMSVPPPGPDYDRVGWYEHSPTPGEIGPSILVGHVDSATGPSVFVDLGSLRPGDTVAITRADGSTAVFVVSAVREYAKADFPTDAVYGSTHTAALRLITCGGPIDEVSGHHRDNVVVFASLRGSARSRS